MTRPVKLKSSYQAIGDQSKSRILPIPPSHPRTGQLLQPLHQHFPSGIQIHDPAPHAQQSSQIDNYQGDYIGNHRSTHRTISIQEPSRSSLSHRLFHIGTRTLHLMLQPPRHSVEKKLFHHLKTLWNMFASPNIQRTTSSLPNGIGNNKPPFDNPLKTRNHPQPPLTFTSPALPFAAKSFPHA
ncbi:hypothetical protein M378DRAFT_169885 [Amanita muscaria Koide BX008]|uniref:Uncharacterized protein n=1 Tax=Amanita muscaria (strain Koide BX008) TaxID=946122 RepID=A0A0C2S8C7_AMAMK|nr:hypothetical protein M378DRAFT_169885 [Amanita muscaria Koide BX008]